MKRRTWIQTAFAVPAAIALPDAVEAQTPTSHDDFAKVETAGSAQGYGEPLHKFFTASEYSALERLADAVMPALNGKPGAVAAGAPAFLDFLISKSPADRQKLYREGLARLSANASLELLTQPWSYQAPSDPFARFLREAKDDILQATFNSREWIEARSGGRGGAGTYYLAVD